MSTNRRTWPVWVRTGLWMIPTRTQAWVYCWAAVLLATVLVVLGVVLDPAFLYGAFLYLAALWYQQSIRWVDENRGWANSPPPEEDEEPW